MFFDHVTIKYTFVVGTENALAVIEEIFINYLLQHLFIVLGLGVSLGVDVLVDR